MLKSILNLEGAKELSKSEQKIVKGSVRIPTCFLQCGPTGGVPDRNHPGQCICY